MTSATSAPSSSAAAAAAASSSSPSATSSASYSSSYVSLSASSTGSINESTNGTAASNATICWLINPQDQSWYTFIINRTNPDCCHTFNWTTIEYYNTTTLTPVNSTVNGTTIITYVNTTTLSNTTVSNSSRPCNATTILLSPASTIEMIRNATCPMVNPDGVALALAFENSTAPVWCSGGAVDFYYVCDPAAGLSQGQCPPANALSTPEGPQQDSIYSANPPIWWRCNYTSPSYSTHNETLAASINIGCTISKPPTTPPTTTTSHDGPTSAGTRYACRTSPALPQTAYQSSTPTAPQTKHSVHRAAISLRSTPLTLTAPRCGTVSINHPTLNTTATLSPSS